MAGAALGAQFIQSGDVRIRFDAKLAPHKLPRKKLQPVTLRTSMDVIVPKGKQPPALHRVTVAINSNGKLRTAGLPTCSRGELVDTTTGEALRRCRGALVGRGRVRGRVALPRTAPFDATAPLLLFNGRTRSGGPEILAHVFNRTRTPVTFVVPIRIKFGDGQFGVRGTVQVPTVASGFGSLTHFNAKVGRTFVSGGRRRGYLNAACRAPAGFSGGPFNLTRATFAFANGRKLHSVITGYCTVRGF